MTQSLVSSRMRANGTGPLRRAPAGPSAKGLHWSSSAAISRASSADPNKCPCTWGHFSFCRISRSSFDSTPTAQQGIPSFAQRPMVARTVASRSRDSQRPLTSDRWTLISSIGVSARLFNDERLRSDDGSSPKSSIAMRTPVSRSACSETSVAAPLLTIAWLTSSTRRDAARPEVRNAEATIAGSAASAS